MPSTAEKNIAEQDRIWDQTKKEMRIKWNREHRIKRVKQCIAVLVIIGVVILAWIINRYFGIEIPWT